MNGFMVGRREIFGIDETVVWRGRWGEVLRYLFYEQNSRVPLPALRTCLTLTFSVRIIYPACETHFKIEFKKKKEVNAGLFRAIFF